MTPNNILLYCRPGFEKEVAAEIMQLSQAQGFPGYIKAKENSGYARFYPTPELDLEYFDQAIEFKKLIFARQQIFVFNEIKDLPDKDRISPLLDALEKIDLNFNRLLLETPDTNEGKELNGFCKKFTTPLIKALEKKHFINAESPWRLHLFFLNSSHVHIGVSHIDNSSPHQMGIKRLRMPKSAPSRSTLKLEEAFKTMMTENEQRVHLKNGMKAVDLGACPGGWTWQLVQRDIQVTAIDNGAMDKALMDTGLVTEIKADGFKYTPERPVDWLVCDMVERPSKIAKLMARWFTEGHCQHAVFNLKLPMKKRYEMVMECKALIESELETLDQYYKVTIKHLYHDREEVTCMIL